MASHYAYDENDENVERDERVERYAYDERDENDENDENVERVVGELNENDLVRPSNPLEEEALYNAALEASLAEETNRNLELQRRCDEACAEVARFKFLLPDEPRNLEY